jgi:hypothetical protein
MHDTSASQVHGVIAAAIDNPRLLKSWLEHPDALREFGIDPCDIDLPAVWKFAGMSTKLRYNNLRKDLPLTFRVLSCTGLEIEVFASYTYRAIELRDSGIKGAEQKLNSFFDFLKTWLDVNDQRHAVIWDVFRHEMSIRQLRSMVESTSDTDIATNVYGATMECVPSIRGALLLQKMTFDPRCIKKALQQHPADLFKLIRGEFYIVYWWNAIKRQTHILNVDQVHFALLSMIDGSRSIREILQRFGFADEEMCCPEVLLRSFEDIGKLGLVSFGTPKL